MPRTAVTLNNPALTDLPFSPAIHAGDFLYVSGQIGIDPATGALAAGAEAQTKKALENVAAVLAAAGKTLDDVVKANVFLVDMDDYQEMNAAYAAVLARPYPARTCVAVAALPLGARVEIEVVAG